MFSVPGTSQSISVTAFPLKALKLHENVLIVRIILFGWSFQIPWE